MTNLRLLAMWLVVAACGHASEISAAGPAGSRATIDGIDMRLSDHGGRCQLAYGSGPEGREMDLQVPWPCDFHRGPDKSVRVKVIRGKHVALIESFRVHPDRPKDCLTQLQAIRVDGARVHPSEHKDTVAMCPPFQWDQKLYIGLFSQ